jgi:hypothetical protein
VRRASVRWPAVRDLRARDAGGGAEKGGGIGAAPVGHFGKRSAKGGANASIGRRPHSDI